MMRGGMTEPGLKSDCINFWSPLPSLKILLKAREACLFNTEIIRMEGRNMWENEVRTLYPLSLPAAPKPKTFYL